MCFWRKPDPKSNGAVLFLFIGLALTLLLAGVVVGKSMVGEAGIAGIAGKEVGAQDAAAALPAGVTDIIGPHEMTAYADYTVIYGYSRGGVPMIGMVQWDRRESGYALRSEIALSSAPNGFAFVDDVTDGPEWGISPVVTVRGPSMSDPRVASVAFVVVHGSGLAQVLFTDGDGTMPAEFMEGETEVGSWDVRVVDVNGDGVPEVLQRERYRLGEVETEETRAYVWDCGRLSFDERLSWALTVRIELFPEPVITP